MMIYIFYGQWQSSIKFVSLFCSFWFCCSRFSISFVKGFVVFAYFLCLRIIFVCFFAKFVMLSVFACHRLVVVFLVALSVRALGLSCSNCSDVSLSQSLTLPRTTHSQFASLNVLPVSYCFYRSKPRRFNSVYLLILILLSGDIHLNPGPVSNTLTVCTLNIRSLRSPEKQVFILDLAYFKSVDIFALTETWITPSFTSAQMLSATPHGFSLISCPRPTSSKNSSKVIGGGTAFLIHEPAVQLSSPSQYFHSFEMSSLAIKLLNSKLTIFNIYRPPSSAKNHKSVPFSIFLEDLDILFSLASTIPHKFLITGDSNLHDDNPLDSHAKQFLSALDAANLTQRVNFPTHCNHHTFDLVITHNSSSLCFTIDYSPVSLSDHYPIFSTLILTPLSPPPLT
jgi:exonuclease III